MRAIQFTAPGRAELTALAPDSDPGEGEALVRTRSMGVCGTDISAFEGRFPFFQFPRIPGHELGVEVVAVGPGVSELEVGDRCTLEPYFNDPDAPTSRRGLTNCCTSLEVFGVHRDGGLRTGAYTVPARKLHPGGSLTYDQLALVEPLAIGFHAVQRAAPRAGQSALVIGAGPIGLACLEFLRLHDLRIVAADLDPQRLEFCRDHFALEHTLDCSPAADPPLAQLELLTGGHLADLVFDATGSARSMSTCFEFAAFGGRVIYVGVGTDDLRWPHAPIFHRRELTLLASRNALSQDFRDIIGLLQRGDLSISPWITHRMHIDEVPSQFATATSRRTGAIKILITT